jgi:diguanylate cyclase (GGDEF)-like protein
MTEARILLVEDNRTEAELTKGFLEKYGYQVTWVETGMAALKIAKTEPVDIVLLDLLLPDINGTEVCRWLKGNEDTRGIPIIMLTIKSSTEDKITGLQIGADDYLPKPYDEVELNARIYASLRAKVLQDELRSKNRALQEILKRVEVLAVSDPLTELYNRRQIEVIVEREFVRTKRYGSPLTCMMIDVDNFKKANEEFGHKAGDMVLRELSEIIKSNIREVDTPARWGGEEFLLLMPETDKEKAMQPATRILERTAAYTFPKMPKGRITVSIGVAQAPASNIESAEQLIDASDLAMYEAKRLGRNRIEHAVPT